MMLIKALLNCINFYCGTQELTNAHQSFAKSRRLHLSKDGPMFCNIGNNRDMIVWRDMKGLSKKFSCKQVWRDINNFGDNVS